MRSKILLLAVLLALVLSLTVGTVSASAEGCREHYVKWGETMYSIGRKYNVDPYYIAQANHIKHPDYIKGGTWICVPHGPAYPGYDHGYQYPRVHYVDWGETLYSIGRKYNVDPYYIAQTNHLKHPDYVRGGTKIYVPAGPPYYPAHDYWYDKGYGHYDKGYGYHDKYYDGYDYKDYDKGHSYSYGY